MGRWGAGERGKMGGDGEGGEDGEDREDREDLTYPSPLSPSLRSVGKVVTRKISNSSFQGRQSTVVANNCQKSVPLRPG